MLSEKQVMFVNIVLGILLLIFILIMIADLSVKYSKGADVLKFKRKETIDEKINKDKEENED